MTDKRLIKDYLAGDKRAVDTVNDIVDLALSAWRDRVGFYLHDIRSDICFKLYNIFKDGSFEGRSSLKTFVARVVSHTCIDYVRYDRKFTDTPAEDLDLPSGLFNPEIDLEKKQLRKMLYRILKTLPKECISLWRLKLSRDMSCREIARQKGRTEEYIRWRLWDCREKAKELRGKILRNDQLI